MKVMILCGGRGTRLKEETEFRPKPMVEVGGKPLLWHIMKIFSAFGYREFVMCLGYKGNMIKEYFLNYEAMNNDFTVQLGTQNKIQFHSNHEEKDWKVTLVDTGEESGTGARIKKASRYIEDDQFIVTYGDGVADINITDLITRHESAGKIGTITGVHPASRFGELLVQGNRVLKFHEKPQVREGLINGGFFVFKKAFLGYLREDDACLMEEGPLEELTAQGELSAYVHEGFWQCVDTYRELEFLNQLWKKGQAPWRKW